MWPNPSYPLAGWSADSQSLYVYRRYPIPARIERFHIATGRREFHAVIQPMTAAVSGLSRLLVTPNGDVFYNCLRNRSTLYAISGLK
jgi:hypothetical protein